MKDVVKFGQKFKVKRGQEGVNSETLEAINGISDTWEAKEAHLLQQAFFDDETKARAGMDGFLDLRVYIAYTPKGEPND